MEGDRIEIDGEVFDLTDPEGKKAAVRAWLKAKSRERSVRATPGAAGEDPPARQDMAGEENGPPEH